MKTFLSLFFSAMSIATGTASDPYKSHLVALMLSNESPHFYASHEHSIEAMVCYDEFGCFKRFPPGVFPEPPSFIRPRMRLHIPGLEKAVKIYNYYSSVGGEDDETKRSLMDRSKKLVIIAHGFGENGNSKWIQDTKNAKTKIYGDNVIVIDWSAGARASTLYVGAAANSVLVARIAARFCLQLVNAYEIPLANIEFIGFSLGAQISGFFAKKIFEETGEKIGKITALDCAAPMFETRGIHPSREHVHFLEALHTAAGKGLLQGRVGMGMDYGHVDYYLNGGIDQPGCKLLDLACSHNRAHEYYVDAITYRDKCLYRGFPCDSVDHAIRGHCNPTLDPTHFIGQENRTTRHTILYLRTNSDKPFCMSDSGM